MDTIDRICLALEPSGDALGVTVRLQNVMATISEGTHGWSRNGQLPAGQRALLQPTRGINARDPGLRQVFQTQQRRR